MQHYPTSTVTDLLINWESSSGSTNVSSPSSQQPRDTTGDFVDPKSLYYGAIYEVEVWIKYNGPKGTVRRKLDLVAKCHPQKETESPRGQATFEVGEVELEKQEFRQLTSNNERLFEADRDYIAHDTIVQDMSSYLRQKGIHNPEELLSLPVR